MQNKVNPSTLILSISKKHFIAFGEKAYYKNVLLNKISGSVFGIIEQMYDKTEYCIKINNQCSEFLWKYRC